MKDKSLIALVTGANKGIGFATVKQLVELGYQVYLGARDEAKGRAAVNKLNAEGFSKVAPLLVDVADAESVVKAAAKFASLEDHLDVLINNAAIGGQQPQTASTINPSLLKEVFETNYFGAVFVTQAFLPFLRKSEIPRVVNVSSELGSLGYHMQSRSEYFAKNLMAYSSSKAALNSYTVMLANELQNTKFKINSVTPGFTATDLNNFTGTRTPEEAANIIAKYATLPSNGPSGQFFGGSGRMPW
jgi:NAD(P)-dependent dehydrogenase (short-subunit alcohol dehydrogenase family)